MLFLDGLRLRALIPERRGATPQGGDGIHPREGILRSRAAPISGAGESGEGRARSRIPLQTPRMIPSSPGGVKARKGDRDERAGPASRDASRRHQGLCEARNPSGYQVSKEASLDAAHLSTTGSRPGDRPTGVTQLHGRQEVAGRAVGKDRPERREKTQDRDRQVNFSPPQAYNFRDFDTAGGGTDIPDARRRGSLRLTAWERLGDV
jgi:hypothetical protein